MLRLETGTKKLSIEVLKRAINFFERITRMEPTRFPKICLDELIALDLSDSDDPKRNWFSQMKRCIADLGFVYPLDGDLVENIIVNKKEIIKKAVQLSFVEDRNRVILSSYCNRYTVLKDIDTLECASSLKFKLPLRIINVFAQLRLNSYNL